VQVLGRRMCMVTATLRTEKVGAGTKQSSSSETVRQPHSRLSSCPDHVPAPALSLAMSRDGSSGGVIRMCVITEGGVERLFIPGDQLPKFWEGRPIKGVPALAPTAMET
jgi:hypothetical protein